MALVGIKIIAVCQHLLQAGWQYATLLVKYFYLNKKKQGREN